MNGTIKTILVIYGIGVVFDAVNYARINNQTIGEVLNTPHPWLWPAYLVKGLADLTDQNNA